MCVCAAGVCVLVDLAFGNGEGFVLLAERVSAGMNCATKTAFTADVVEYKSGVFACPTIDLFMLRAMIINSGSLSSALFTQRVDHC